MGSRGHQTNSRTGCAGLGQVRATYPKFQWSSGDLKEVTLSLISSFGPHEKTPLVKLKLRKFVPGPRDNIDLDWNSNGLVKTQKLPAYAIVRGIHPKVSFANCTFSSTSRMRTLHMKLS